jgi:adenylate kinase family enzyme
MNRIVVIGVTGSGKTTSAGHVGRLFEMPHIELDALHWNPNWQESSREDFIKKVDAATRSQTWVVDGNYTSKVAHLVWARADTVVWLDFSFRRTLSRLLVRTLRRVLFDEECCNGNQETLKKVFSKDSIILWAFRSYWRHQREFPEKISDPAHEHLVKVRLRSPKEADQWLEQVKQTRANPGKPGQTRARLYPQ